MDSRVPRRAGRVMVCAWPTYVAVLLRQERTEYEHTFEHAIMLLDVSNGNEQALTSHHQQQGWSWDWTADQQWILGSSSRETLGQWGLYLYPLAAAPNAETQSKTCLFAAGI